MRMPRSAGRHREVIVLMRSNNVFIDGHGAGFGCQHDDELGFKLCDNGMDEVDG